MRSLCLYQSLGFDVTEPVMIMSGKPRSVPVDGVEVRSLEVGDIDACETLCKQVHGWERTGELRDAMQAFAPFVVVRDGQVAGYLTTATMWPMAHGVAATEEDMEALLLGVAAQSEEPLSFLAPIRWELYRWALREGAVLPEEAIHDIRVLHRFSFVEVTPEEADRTVEFLDGTKLKGKEITLPFYTDAAKNIKDMSAFFTDDPFKLAPRAVRNCPSAEDRTLWRGPCARLCAARSGRRSK